MVDRTVATGLTTRPGKGSADRPRVTGVQTGDGTIDADLVIDAMGRRTPTPSWIAAAGARPMPERTNDCSIIYYCRYYRTREGVTLADSPSVPGPRGDLGYAAFTTFPGDNRTFCALIATPPADQALKVVRDSRAFEAAVATMPALDAWTNADTAEPITDVMPMGSLQNTIRSVEDGRPPVIGLVGIGDAIVHTDPALSLGLSFALIHARHLVTAVRDAGGDPAGAALAFEALARPEMEERFVYVSEIDDTRTRLWAGESIDYSHRAGDAYAFFTYGATGVASLADGDLARALARRNTFLDPLAVLDGDPALLEKLERFWQLLLIGARRSPAGPPRNELLDVMRVAVPVAS